MKTDIFILCKMQNEKTFYWNFESSEKRKWIRIRRLRHNAIRLLGSKQNLVLLARIVQQYDRERQVKYHRIDKWKW